jgi:hypothetical protein
MCEGEGFVRPRHPVTGLVIVSSTLYDLQTANPDIHGPMADYYGGGFFVALVLLITRMIMLIITVFSPIDIVILRMLCRLRLRPYLRSARLVRRVVAPGELFRLIPGPPTIERARRVRHIAPVFGVISTTGPLD